MSYENTLQQLLMADGHEILAHIVEWDESLLTIKANNILVMIPYDMDMDEDSDGKSYYILRPWISYLDDLERTSLITRSSIVAVTQPAPVIAEQFYTSLSEINRTLDEDDKKDSKRKGSNVFSFTGKHTPPSLLTE